MDPNAGCPGEQDLVKSRTRVEAVKTVEARAPLLVRLRLGRLSIARNERLDLVDCVCVEERVGESVKNLQFGVVGIPLTQRKMIKNDPRGS